MYQFSITHMCLCLLFTWAVFLSPPTHAASSHPNIDATHAGEELTWAVRLDPSQGSGRREELDALAEELSHTAGLENRGVIGELRDHYLFAYMGGGQDREDVRRKAHDCFTQHDSVRWFSEQKLLKRSKRSLHFNDPKYPLQWHLSPEGSYDLNSNDPDPMPHPDGYGDNHHGTRCAGEIAAVPNNSFCAVGVAYGSRIAGIRVLDGPLTDSMEAIAFNKHYQINDIYSCSWGPDDDGKTVDGPHQLGKAALQHGVIAGRKGFGSIFVVASGNGGRYNDNCNYDGYANSIYTVTIGAVNEAGKMPFYAEECASMLAVTFSSGDRQMRSIVTSDWDLQKGTGCTEGHTGTSAAAPIAAGMIALMLQVRPCLTWRDVQHIIVFAATKYEDHQAAWETNGAGFSHSHQHGFGLLNAWRLTNAAKVWESVPYLASYVSPVFKENKNIPLLPSMLQLSWNVTSADLLLSGMRTLEHVSVMVTITHPRRGNLQIQLFCPSGMSSLIGATRKIDSDPSGFSDWTFSTVRCWGENAEGMYRLLVSDMGDESLKMGTFQSWQLTLYGSSWTPEDVAERSRLVETSQSGQFLNGSFSLPCPPGLEISEQENYIITSNTLRTLMLLGCFAVFWSLYYTVELYLSRISSSKDLSCEGSACIWSRRRGSPSPRQLEAGSETESLPLCGLQDAVLEDDEEEDIAERSTLHRHQSSASKQIREQNTNPTGHRQSVASDFQLYKDRVRQDASDLDADYYDLKEDG
ncbi:proprotein convertase subtilisin/kexin type 7 isoform X2 [Pseudophryne corroboree]|uniref:proprotein convertase subtilisin/kexin type 7 isoform X2 n=1 Tax=Pseudophryne corroboree TaxID=495146 RepID=UPI003081549E